MWGTKSCTKKNPTEIMTRFSSSHDRHVLKPGLDCGLWTTDCGLWTVDYGLWTVEKKRGGGVDPSLSLVNRGGRR